MGWKQRPSFFKNALKPGTPLSVKGLAEGLMGIAKALEYMNVTNGNVTWTDGVPTISTSSSIPALPTSDGVYFLSCSVSSGVKTLSWVETIEAGCGT